MRLAPSLRLLMSSLWLAPSAALLIAAEAPRLEPAQLSGGILTIADESEAAYLQPAPSLEGEELKLFSEGHKFFNTQWAFYWFEGGMWGRGPTSNADSCVACHRGNGRGSPDPPSQDTQLQRAHVCSAPPQGPERDSSPQLLCRRIEASALSLIVRLSLPGENAHGGPRPHPHCGDQLQTFGVPRLLPAEGTVQVAWNERSVTLADGEVVRLRTPQFRIADLGFGPLGEDIMVSPRMAPPLIGMGLLEAIPDATILALAARAPKDGIRGKVNVVWDLVAGKNAVGRFGLKANHPTLRQQIAAAFIGDLGLSNELFPEQNCPPIQKTCKEMMFAGNPEITTYRLKAVESYLRTLAVPASRNAYSTQVARGAQLFDAARCAVCHVPQLQTGEFPAAPLLANQAIRPYTDLLLHDMGEELADHRPDHQAGGSEWRTPPLWGLGLSEKVNGHGALLHDGRARNAAEAILWHSGEAAVSREAYRTMSKTDRDAVLAFLASL
ncbi:MAG TPA: di-heme oxidoredictase family protein [Burkholderiales bacterium]|nr:di-heme oxidoredictase family protein [Burkholderiales bacterium]